MQRARSWALVWTMALGTSALAGHASAQVRVVTGDGLCPPGEAPMTLAQANAQRDSLCPSLGRWHIARLADGASMDGPGYQCQTRANDTRSLGHTICVPAANVGPVVPPPAILVTPGVYDGWHPHWNDTVTLQADGTYWRGNGDPGRWSVKGRTLVLAWRNWGPERLDLQPDGSFRAPTNGFTLRLRATPPTVPPPAPPPAMIVTPGVYDGWHPHWQDTVILEPDGTYRRGSGDPGRWSVEGRTLVLAWNHWGPERLDLQPDGSYRAPTNGFTLRLRTSTQVVVVAPPPPGLDASLAIGEYDAQHPQWRDSIELLSSSSLRRRGRAAGRWRIEGAELVLTWRRGPESRLTLHADQSWRSVDGLVLTRKGVAPPPPAPPPPTTGPRVRVRITN
jgi:hypothetical protein